MGTKLSPRAVQERWDLEHMEKKKMLASNLVVTLRGTLCWWQRLCAWPSRGWVPPAFALRAFKTESLSNWLKANRGHSPFEGLFILPSTAPALSCAHSLFNTNWQCLICGGKCVLGRRWDSWSQLCFDRSTLWSVLRSCMHSACQCVLGWSWWGLKGEQAGKWG